MSSESINRIEYLSSMYAAARPLKIQKQGELIEIEMQKTQLKHVKRQRN